MSDNSRQHDFDAAIALTGEGENAFLGQTHPGYGNMVGPFGGVIAATLMNAVMQHPQRLGEPVSQTVHFAAPIPDGAYSVHTRIMRTNRTTQHWQVELLQDGEVAAFATLVTALRRDTWSALDAVFPEVPPAASIAPAPPIARAAWTARYEMRFVDGAPLVTDAASETSQTRMWIRDTPGRPLDFLSLAAMSDAFYPRIFVRRPRWVPIGTVALTTFFHADARQLDAQGNAPLLGVARALRFGNGFFDQSAEMWSEQGELLATSHQVVYFKE
ncbi:acyl-CoA thioesterase [Telluria sp. B2]